MTGPERVLTNGLRLAVGTLTALPVPAPGRVGRPEARVAMLTAPLAVLPIAACAGLAGWLAIVAGLPPLPSAVLAVGTLALGTRGLHLDGLADTADGLAVSYDREKALEVMRRGNTGPAGATALVLVLALQVAAGAALFASAWGVGAFVVLGCLSRASLAITCAAGVPPARPGGLGAAVSGAVPRPLGAASAVLAAAAACAVLAATGRPWWLGGLAVVAAALVVLGLTRRCVRRWGGVTGDVMGAGVEIAFAALLVVGAAGS